ncbi:hypothetical protein N7532_006027 [Penicillium argentinense]|uniref:Flavin reductase like domain-containing protein n=1 Tax=Penicillium argentinense TaxID=1131581 RepID=A0A9W9FF77_9EURO|nr:uncharacterized protein N7532_006027 [Penicillium argentinense]KAJ5099026.1 hypothetical protein N7532_006027 [Penicillium argentinense]
MPPKRKATQEPDTLPKKESTKKDTKPFKDCPISKAYRFIEPGPLLLVTTGSLASKTHNIMTLGFHMMMQHESPPLIGITLGPWDASFKALKEKQECVLTVPSTEIAETVIDIGNISSDDLDSPSGKWERFGLEPLPAGKVQAPLVSGPHVMANIECVVEDMSMVKKYNMWVLRVVKAWENPMPDGGTMAHHCGQGVLVGDGLRLDFSHRMDKWQEFLDG